MTSEGTETDHEVPKDDRIERQEYPHDRCVASIVPLFRGDVRRSACRGLATEEFGSRGPGTLPLEGLLLVLPAGVVV